MDSISRRHKLQKVGEAAKIAKSIDKISGLPDSVLCHILSFLPTKYAVGTSILSTRWRYLFASIPSLDFDDSLLLRPRGANENMARKMSVFMNFVDRGFILRNISYVDIFRLKCGQNIDTSRLNAWICAALWRNIRELDLCISVKDFTMLPRDLFTCGTLVVLKLGAKFVLNIPIKVCLPNLKIIRLDDIEFLDDDSIHRLISGCPELEDLVILGCDWNNIRIFNISAPALKSLTINCLVVESEYTTEFCKYKIVLNAPNLVYLKYIDFVPEGFSVKNLQSLVEAYIDVGFSGQQFDDDINDCNESIAEILRGISKVQFLHLSDGSMEAIVLSYNQLPTFSNMTRLELGVSPYVGWQLLPDLIQSSPILETLAFVEGLLLDNYSCESDSPQDVPSCLLFHLETIEIETFSVHKDGLDIVEYFLKNARVLKKLTIRTYGMTEKEELKVSKELLMLPRGSNACQVAII